MYDREIIFAIGLLIGQRLAGKNYLNLNVEIHHPEEFTIYGQVNGERIANVEQIDITYIAKILKTDVERIENLLKCRA